MEEDIHKGLEEDKVMTIQDLKIAGPDKIVEMLKTGELAIVRRRSKGYILVTDMSYEDAKELLKKIPELEEEHKMIWFPDYAPVMPIAVTGDLEQ